MRASVALGTHVGHNSHRLSENKAARWKLWACLKNNRTLGSSFTTRILTEMHFALFFLCVSS